MRKYLVAVTLFLTILPVRGETLRDSLTDQEFWRLVTSLSEPDGNFQAQVMSNEDSAQFVIPNL
jgi:membrane carboxypeptidase/penicillin-binding protein PbpC